MIKTNETTEGGKTLVFCTAYSPPYKDKYYNWEVRYRIWLEAIRRSGVSYDQILIVDDGSSGLPSWADVIQLREGGSLISSEEAVLFSFDKHLGRKSLSRFPGWVRSFFFASEYARLNQFERVVHIEADAFIIGHKCTKKINSISSGWNAFWCPTYNRPESGIQIIAGSSLATYHEWAQRPVEAFDGLVIEDTLPFTSVIKEFFGDRCGVGFTSKVPAAADWCMQARPEDCWSYTSYFWWMPWFRNVFPELDGSIEASGVEPQSMSADTSEYVDYLDWVARAIRVLGTETFLEIRANAGHALARIGCDSISVAPQISIDVNSLSRRHITVLYQGASQEFFSDEGRVRRLLPTQLGMGSLDGMHYCEQLLHDFVEVERICFPGSIVILHDCLPLNVRMAQRIRDKGGLSEPEVIRDFWTGDVWKMLPVLKRFRADLNVCFINCKPINLVVCTNLNSLNTTLSDEWDGVLAYSAELELESYTLERLFGLYPLYHPNEIPDSEAGFRSILFPEKNDPVV